MRLVIDIPNSLYANLKKIQRGSIASKRLFDCIKEGTPLPKGHGDLKDFQKMYADMKEKEELARQRVIDTPTNSPCYMRYVAQLNERTAFKEMLYDAPTIIEADTEGVEE
jgi:hypothetical protein